MTAAGRYAALAWPASAFVAVLVVIALIGGGWLALGRVDPLLAVPGAGWAAVAALWAGRGRPVAWMLFVAAGAGAIALGLTAMIMAPGWLRGGEWLMAVIALFAATLPVAALARAGAHFASDSKIRRRLVAFFALPIVALTWSALAWPVVDRVYAVEDAVDPPRVTLVTALPLDGGGDIAAQLAGVGEVAPALALLEARTRLTRADVPDAVMLAQTDALLLAHPRLLPPEALVAIDGWVRDGGRAVILADGLSSWPSPHALGDPRNPPVSSLLGPLLGHWGLDLEAPRGLAETVVTVRDSRQRLRLLSAGRLISRDSACRVIASGMIAECRIGRGAATIVGDADMLGAEHWAGRRGAASSVDWTSGNMMWLLDKLGDHAPLSMAMPSWAGGAMALERAGE